MIERMIRRAVGAPKESAKIRGLQERHVDSVVDGGVGRAELGTANRSRKIRGWVARMVLEGKVVQKITTEWGNEWLSQREARVDERRGEEAWMLEAGDVDAAATARAQGDREEATSTVETWMDEHDEAGREGVRPLRPERLKSMQAARCRVWKRLGGADAMWAALAVMVLEGRVVPLVDRGAGGVVGQRGDWIQKSIGWAEDAGWLYPQEGQGAAQRAQARLQQMRSRAVVREGYPGGDGGR